MKRCKQAVHANDSFKAANEMSRRTVQRPTVNFP
jgi:hypothetical protein